jgi:hypothetical protein
MAAAANRLVAKMGSGRMSAFDLDADVPENTVLSTRVLRERAKARMAASLNRDRTEEKRAQQEADIARRRAHLKQQADAVQSAGAEGKDGAAHQLGLLDIGKSYLLANRVRKGDEHLVTKEEREARRKALFEHSAANHLAGTIPHGRDPFRPASLRKLGLKSRRSSRSLSRSPEKQADDGSPTAAAAPSPAPSRDGHEKRRHNSSFQSLTGPSQRAMRARGSFRWVPTVRKHDAIPYMEALEAWRSDDERADFWERATREYYWRESHEMQAERPAFSGAQDQTVAGGSSRRSRYVRACSSSHAAGSHTKLTRANSVDHCAAMLCAARTGARPAGACLPIRATAR